MASRLAKVQFTGILTAVARARQTCELAGFGRQGTSTPIWWNGTTGLQGKRTVDIHQDRTRLECVARWLSSR